nr:hypothetical protein [Propionicimonas sp.]
MAHVRATAARGSYRHAKKRRTASFIEVAGPEQDALYRKRKRKADDGARPGFNEKDVLAASR